MKLDKAAFLSLTAAVAAASCTVGKNEGATDGGADGGTSADSSVTTDSSTSDSSTSDSTCNDSVAAPTGDAGPLCPVGEAGAGCLNFFECDTRSAWLKPRLARIWQECLATSDVTTCSVETGGSAREKCAGTVTAAACPDSTVEAFCNQLRTACGDGGSDAGIVQADCIKLATPLSTAGRERLSGCFVESGCSSIEFCVPYN